MGDDALGRFRNTRLYYGLDLLSKLLTPASAVVITLNAFHLTNLAYGVSLSLLVASFVAFFAASCSPPGW